jgi:hypothetical protein
LVLELPHIGVETFQARITSAIDLGDEKQEARALISDYILHWPIR